MGDKVGQDERGGKGITAGHGARWRDEGEGSKKFEQKGIEELTVRSSAGVPWPWSRNDSLEGPSAQI